MENTADVLSHLGELVTVLKRLRAKMKFLPLHYKLLMWFVMFSLIMMVFLWVFQTVFFRTFYKEVRVNQVKECSSSIEDNITSENVTTLVENLAEQNDVVIYVYETGSSLIKPLYSTDKSYMRICLLGKKIVPLQKIRVKHQRKTVPPKATVRRKTQRKRTTKILLCSIVTS